MTHEALKRKLALAGKVLAANGQGDFTRGHISARLQDTKSGKQPLFVMKPHSVGLDEITPGNILTIDLDGNVVAGKARRHSEVFIHSEIYKMRADVGCVVHSHPPYAIALSGSGRPIKALSQAGALFRGEAGVYDDTIALIRSAELGKGVARALRQGRAVLLKNHGVVVAGASIEETVIGAIMLETAAMIQLAAEAAGDMAPEFPEDDIATLKAQLSKPEQFAINFDYLARRVTRRR